MLSLDYMAESVGEEVDRLWPDETIFTTGLCLAEETGEVCRAIVKRNHGRRGTHQDWTANLRLEIGQVVIVCLDLARREGFSMEEALLDAYSQLQGMDPDHDPVRGNA